MGVDVDVNDGASNCLSLQVVMAPSDMDAIFVKMTFPNESWHELDTHILAQYVGGIIVWEDVMLKRGDGFHDNDVVPVSMMECMFDEILQLSVRVSDALLEFCRIGNDVENDNGVGEIVFVNFVLGFGQSVSGVNVNV